MADTLLRSLREQLLDESEPLAGLLRKCLLLGAETGSDALRAWARSELNGYGDDDAVPKYRQITGMPITVDSTSGNTWTRGQTIDRLELPKEARSYVPEGTAFRQPVEEMEQLAGQQRLSFTTPGLSYARSVWNRELGPFQSVIDLHYVMSGSVFAGILGQIRTRLVELVADLTADTPISELPKKEQVDAAVNQRIGDVYNTTILNSGGPLAIGKKARANSEGLSIEDALRLLDEVDRTASRIEVVERAELIAAVAELRSTVKQDAPETGDVVKKVRKLRAIAEKIGVASVSASTSSAAQALTELAVNGAFG